MPSQAGNPWFSWDYVRANQETLLTALQEHILLTVLAVLLAVAIAIPLSILAHRVNWLAGPILSATGTLYTLPSLALFAFLAPFTGVANIRTPLIVLVLYALLVVVRAGLTGLQQVPAEIREVAAGMGYGSLAKLFRIELPLALPSIMTGVRIATVTTVALVTVGDIVGTGGFGTVILGGFNANFYRAQIMTGTIACVALALVLDALLVLFSRLVIPWNRGRRA